MQNRVVAIYSRKSKYTGKGESIENQIELCRQYIHTHFPQVADGDLLVYEDEGFSGGNTQRPRFRQMMDAARSHKISAVVCYRLDRVSRNIGDFAKLIEELDSLGVAFISIKEQFDTASPMGRAMMYISSVFSQLERETIAERIRDNMQELAKSGRWLGGVTPTGYTSEQVRSVAPGGKVKKSCRLKLQPDEAHLVRVIFDTFAQTNSLAGTEALLLQHGLRTKRNNQFSRFTLKNILTNPVYMMADGDAYRYFAEKGADLCATQKDFDGTHGVMAYNRTIQKPGKAHQIRPVSQWVVAVGGHPGIISGGNWVQVQETLEQNRSKSYRKPRGNTALLSGLLFCGSCGSAMRPKLSTRLNPLGQRVFSYVCTLKERSHTHSCNIKNPGGNALDREIWQVIKRLDLSRPDILRQLEQGRQTLAADPEPFGCGITALQRALEQNKKEIDALVSALAAASGSAAREYILPQINSLHAVGEEIRQRITTLQDDDKALDQQALAALVQTLASPQKTLDNMAVTQQRAALRACVEKVVWDGENAHVYLSPSAEPPCEYSK